MLSFNASIIFSKVKTLNGPHICIVISIWSFNLSSLNWILIFKNVIQFSLFVSTTLPQYHMSVCVLLKKNYYFFKKKKNFGTCEIRILPNGINNVTRY